MIPPTVKVTSAALIFALVDSALVFFLARSIRPKAFGLLKWRLTVTAACFWGLVWLLMSVELWGH